MASLSELNPKLTPDLAPPKAVVAVAERDIVLDWEPMTT